MARLFFIKWWVGRKLYTMADQPMARLPKMARDVHCCPNIYIFFGPTSVSILWTCVRVHISDCVETVYKLPLVPNNTASETFLYCVKCGLGIYHWGAGIAVIGRICGIGQNVLQSSFQRGSSSSPQLLKYFLPYRILRGGFIRNIIITLCVNYIIIIWINDNNAVVNNNYGRLQDLILLFKIPMGTRINFFEIYSQSVNALS